MERESLRIWQGAVLLTLLSGAAALSHQVLWTRRMVDLLGAGSESTVRVFAGFFLGLAVGSAIGGYVAGRVGRAWRALGLAEICCGVLAVPLVLLPMWTGGLWQRIGPEGLDGIAGTVAAAEPF